VVGTYNLWKFSLCIVVPVTVGKNMEKGAIIIH